nr:lysosomal alpha-glucosidase-like [Onthophagus taurus]
MVVRIRNMLRSFHSRNTRQPEGDTVSFEAFGNESVSDFPDTKESSLTEEYKKSPKFNKGKEYVQFSPQTTNISECSRPSLATILLLVLLTAIFLILPIIYLLHVFDVIHIAKEDFHHSRLAMKDKEHYEPSLTVHERLQNGFPYILRHPKRSDLPPPPKPEPQQCKIITDSEKFDCYPEDGANQQKCEERGCCWVSKKQQRIRNGVPLDIPYCFYPGNYPTYKYVNITETAFGLVAFLKRNYRSGYPNDTEVLKMIVKFETDKRLHVKLTDSLVDRFETPYPELPIVDKSSTNLSYNILIDETSTGFKIVRKADNTTIFDTSRLRNLIFSNLFIQISSRLPSKYIYGLGEHRTNLLLDLNWQKLTLFNHDGAPSENANLYGSHPFYLVMEQTGNSHGVFLLNSNAMDIILQPTPAITYRTIGGVLDFYYFLGPTPSNVISQYTELIGRPHLPPYWGLGFHLCRFGYKSVNDTKTILQKNLDAGILIDTQWNDLDYMNSSNDFTYDHENFKDLPQFVKELHEKGMHYVPLIDPGISASEIKGTYPPYDIGIAMNIFIKNSTGQPFIGKVWNRVSTVWPDFTNPKTVDYWTLMLKSMHDKFQYDGAWIDMNEPANFLSGSVNGCPNSDLETPPYVPGVLGGQLNYKTLCMTAQHYIGLHYDVHNIYGFSEAMVTNFALAEIRGKRPFVISRASFPGLGKFAGRWSGDDYSLWHDMKYSVPQMLSYSLFGIPLMGSDICGFNGNTTVSLCNRWVQLGAFYPFSRSHNTDDGIPQDPVSLGPGVTESARKALEIRYSLLPYLYTLFWCANVEGETVARPVFFEYPQDAMTYNIDYMFFWGSAVLIIPVLEENNLSVGIYLPKNIWYDYYTKQRIISTGENKTLAAPLDMIPILIKSGSIIPQQQPNKTTTFSRQSKIELLCAPDINKMANGKLYWDDGDSLNVVEERKYSLLQFQLKTGKLTSEPVWWNEVHPPNLGAVTIMGMFDPVREVMINNVSQRFKYDTIYKYLIIDNLDINFSNAIVITWH